MYDALCDDCLPRAFCYLVYFLNFLFKFSFQTKIFLIFSYFLGDLRLTVLIKRVLYKKKKCSSIAIGQAGETSSCKQGFTRVFFT